jgi:hypothetical protein
LCCYSKRKISVALKSNILSTRENYNTDAEKAMA